MNTRDIVPTVHLAAQQHADKAKSADELRQENDRMKAQLDELNRWKETTTLRLTEIEQRLNSLTAVSERADPEAQSATTELVETTESTARE